MSEKARCPTCKMLKKRSDPQNRRLHKLFTELAANVKAKDGEYHNHHWWKVMCKDQWLGYDEYKRPDGKMVCELRHTGDLDVAELNVFMEQVENHAASLGVFLDEGI